MIAPTAVVYPGVELGANVTIEDFCIIGAPFGGGEGEKTRIGDGALIRSHTVIYAGNTIGRNFQTGHKANIRECNTIGDNVSIGSHSVIEHHVTIENNVRVHTQAFVPEYSTLKDSCWLGPNVVLTNAKLPRSRTVKESLVGPTVERGAIIGANSTLLPGVVIGEKALVGAGSIVTRNVDPRTVVAGNPARVMGSIDSYKEYS